MLSIPMAARYRPAVIAAAIFALSGCADGSPLAPEVTPAPLPADAAVLQCVADVAAEEIVCERPTPPRSSGPSLDLLVGGQDLYVRLTSSGTSYDEGTGEFRSTVTVQNLTRNTMGTDGVDSPGVSVFFHSGPVTTGGAGNVTVLNEDGTGTFTATNQPFFLYPSVLEPLQISAGREWVFGLDSGVTNFSFMVYVSTPMVEETVPLLGPVWSGLGGDTDWTNPANWQGSRLPAADSAVTIPTDTVIGAGTFPALTGDAAVQHLRIGAGSTLDLDGNVIEVGGNLDVSGSVTGGTVRMTNSASLIGGTVPALEITGSSRLQRPISASGPVSVSGTLTVTDRTFTVSIP